MFAVADQRRFRPWLLASALVHALGAALMIAARPMLPSAPPEPLRVVRVDLIAGVVAPGPPAAAPPARPAPVDSAPPPTRVAAKPPVPEPLAPERLAPAPPAPAAPSAAEPASPAAGSSGGSGASEGVALAAVSTGPPGGGGSGSGADALADYIARLQRAIDAQKTYPSMARRRGIEGVVTVRLAIDAYGALVGTSLVGRPPEILARSTREAVSRAGPFPPPPAGALQVEFPVRYEIVD